MGTPAYIQDGLIGFDAPESAAEAFKIISEWVNKVKLLSWTVILILLTLFWVSVAILISNWILK